MDDKDRKITFKGPNSYHRNDERWKIDLFLRVQNCRERACPFGLGQQERKMCLVVIFGDDGNIVREIPLEREGSGYYSILDSASSSGTLYKYRLDDDLVPDIASRFQPQGVHGPSQVVDGRSFRWTDSGWKPPALHELVIYELHVGTFTQEGTFEAIAAHFDHLKGIGVNAIELMPVADFAGDWNWGYDGVSIYAPSRAYGKPDDFRTLVNAAHRGRLGRHP